jgi:hypothetical protein
MNITKFGDLRGLKIADKNVPAEEIKIGCRGHFEKMPSRKANEIKGF